MKTIQLFHGLALSVLAVITASTAIAQFPCEIGAVSGDPAVGGESTMQGGQYHDNSAYHLKFETYMPVVIDSVKVFANGAGERSIALLNSNGDVILAEVFDLPSGESYVALGFEVPQGAGFGLALLNDNPQLWRDDVTADLNYPYEIGELASITGSNVNGENQFNYYYFFYDWAVSPGAAVMNSAGYPCWNVELLDVEPLSALGGGSNGNDCWGWVHEESGREIALYGRDNGTAFIDITDPTEMKYFANLETASVPSLWRDMKVYNDHVFIVSEAGSHGMQVVDLNALMDLPLDEVTELEADAYYDGFGNAHNIAINEETGYAYGIGTSTFSGGIHAVDISDALNPVLAGSYSGAYTHDLQAVVYSGPDADHTGDEIGFCFNGSGGVRIVDLTDKTDIVSLSSLTYAQLGYTHQGWLSEDQRYCFLNDELDELNYGNNTRTHIIDVSDLESPQSAGYFESDNTAIDHNMYVKGDFMYQANYLSGLRILDVSQASQGTMEVAGYFDTNPGSDAASFDGAWSNYPYFPSGSIIISSQSHFFVVGASDDLADSVEEAVKEDVPARLEVFPNPAANQVQLKGFSGMADLVIVNMQGAEVLRRERLPVRDGFYLDIQGLAKGAYVVSLNSAALPAPLTTQLLVQ